MKSFVLVLGLTALFTTEVMAGEFVCAKDPRVNGRCYWGRGLFNVTNGRTAEQLTLEEAGEKAVVGAPSKLEDLIGPVRIPDADVYVVGDFLFCPMATSAFESNDELEPGLSYGCIDAYKNVVEVPYTSRDTNKTFESRVCKLVDCSKPGFSDFSRRSK